MRISHADLEKAVQLIIEWTGHPGAFYPVFKERITRVRSAFATVFDEGRDVAERLSAVAPGGAKKLSGIGLTAWTLMLSWRRPEEYPPFDRRTIRFLKDAKLAHHMSTSIGPHQYERWLSFAADLAGRLSLPTRGHVDRVVWQYTRRLTL